MVNRKSDKGVWRSELWTKRAFEPFEIQLGPWSSQLKDTHLMASAHAVVGLPKHGRGAHPDNLSLAFDGRGRNLVAPSELLSTEEHKGSLFWIVQRTSKASDANLVFENVTFETQVIVRLPAPKKRKIEASLWGPEELPSIPTLVNKGSLKKHIQLFCSQPEKKKDDKNKET